MRKSLEEIYGIGIGRLMSYQDFGDRAFDKMAQHMDLTLNGYVTDAQSTLESARVHLLNGGRGRVDAITQKSARAFRLDAHASPPGFWRRVEGIKRYFRALKYHWREMVDLGKFDYDPKTQKRGGRVTATTLGPR